MSNKQFTVITEQQQIEAPSSQLVLPFQFVGNLTPDSETPSVKNITRCRCINTTPVTISNFINGQEGQEIVVLGDGQTTVDNTTTISPTGGAHLLDDNAIYRFVLLDGLWHESNAIGPTGATGTPGADGIDGAPGMNGVDGIDGTNGMDGAPGIDGVDGSPGIDGMDGAPGATGPVGPPGSDTNMFLLMGG